MNFTTRKWSQNDKKGENTMPFNQEIFCAINITVMTGYGEKITRHVTAATLSVANG